MDFPITNVYWNPSTFFGEGDINYTLTASVVIATSDFTSETVNLELSVTVPKIPGEITKTNADMQAVNALLSSIPNADLNISGNYSWSLNSTYPQTIHNIEVTDNETPTGEGIVITGTAVPAPDPLQGLVVEYSTVTINTPNDKIEGGGSAVIIQPGGDIQINAGGNGVVLEGPAPTEPNHVVTKKYVDENAPIHLTINNMVEAPFMELAGFYQDNVRTAVERVLQETDGVSIHQFALESDFINTTLETMTLNELVELLTHVAIVGR